VNACIHLPVIDGLAFETYIETQLAPALEPGTVVILDNLSTHKNPHAGQALKDRGCWFLFLPPYSPDLNPIEMAFSKLKAHLRRIGARSGRDTKGNSKRSVGRKKARQHAPLMILPAKENGQDPNKVQGFIHVEIEYGASLCNTAQPVREIRMECALMRHSAQGRHRLFDLKNPRCGAIKRGCVIFAKSKRRLKEKIEYGFKIAIRSIGSHDLKGYVGPFYAPTWRAS
jgi:transposase